LRLPGTRQQPAARQPGSQAGTSQQPGSQAGSSQAARHQAPGGSQQPGRQRAPPEVVVRHHLGLDEAALKVCVDDARRLGRERAVEDGPAPHLRAERAAAAHRLLPADLLRSCPQQQLLPLPLPLLLPPPPPLPLPLALPLLLLLLPLLLALARSLACEGAAPPSPAAPPSRPR
jgi:hypothetical protein